MITIAKQSHAMGEIIGNVKTNDRCTCTPEQFELVSHCQICLQSAVSVLEYDLATLLIYSRVGKNNVRICLYFFEPIITVLGGANPGCSDGAPCKTDC